MIDRYDKIIDSIRCGGSMYVLAEHGADYIIYCDGNVRGVYSSYADAQNDFNRLK